MTVSASIVIYNSDFFEVCSTIDSFLSCDGNLVIVDNASSIDILEKLKEKYKDIDRISYLYLDQNVGYGSGNNRGFYYLKQYNKLGKYHIIINPDITIFPDCIANLEAYMNRNQDIVLSVPQILNKDGTIQYLNREHPNIFDMFIRRFLPKFLQNLKIIKKRYNNFIRMSYGYGNICEVPSVSGCFMFFRAEIFDKLNGFDEKIFLYMEDSDISRRAWKFGKVMFNPNAKVYHVWKRESHKNWKMTILMIKSMIYYFRKHGIKIL